MDNGPSTSFEHDFYEDELQREADMRLQEEVDDGDGESSSDEEEEEDEEGEGDSDHGEFDTSGDEMAPGDDDSDSDSVIDSEEDIPLIELQKRLKEAKRKVSSFAFPNFFIKFDLVYFQKKHKNTPPEFENRNDMPKTPASYERNFGAGKKKRSIVWKVAAPSKAQVNGSKLVCDAPEKAQLSEEAEDLLGCKDVLAIYKRIIEEGMVQR